MSAGISSTGSDMSISSGKTSASLSMFTVTPLPVVIVLPLSSITTPVSSEVTVVEPVFIITDSSNFSSFFSSTPS